jgi:hypothetical protein
LNKRVWAEPTVQQERTPQPPPGNPPEGDGIGDGASLSEADLQLKEDRIFFTSLVLQFGHFVSFPDELMFSRTENCSLHFKQIYS